MITFSTVTLFVALRFLLLLVAPTSLVGAAPATFSNQTAGISNQTSATSSSYWVANIQRQGTVAFGDASYTVFRNVQDYGATGDGSTDDTAAINAAISDGNRCGQGCDSSTTTPAIVYFPPGTYLVSSPIIQYYYTQLIGDAVTIPTLKAAASFTGIAVIDSDPYAAGGVNWYTNQNNFFRQVRNFVIDLTGQPASTGTGIHWQVAQATSLQNIVFNMIQGAGTKQQGIFMDNGSGGFMTDLVFNGGNYGAFFGNQQFTTRNLTFNNCQTAIYMNWDWVWTFKSISINNCGIGIDMSTVTVPGGNNQTVGTVLVQDSTFSGTPTGIKTAYTNGNDVPPSGGTLIIDNTDFTGTTNAVVNAGGATVLAGGSKVSAWAQGNVFSGSSAAAAKKLSPRGTNSTSVNGTATGPVPNTAVQGSVTAPSKPVVLLDGTGAIFERSKPQYETVPASSFLSVKSAGAKGDGVTDDTQAIQNVLNSATTGQVVYFDHGAYLISSTVKVPSNIKITGEIWPLIMASGSAFSNQANPAPVFQVGQAGDTGAVEMSDLIFETKGAQPGAILMEWNVADPAGQQGASGMWDVHFRIGGSAGTELQSDTCAADATSTAVNTQCEGAFMLLHITAQATIYLENNWFWVADHELDLSDHDQTTIYNGRGVYIESTNAVWMYGTSSEHSQLYNYQLANAKNVYMAIIQTETPYYQSNPNALSPFTPNSAYNDPTFSDCSGGSCDKSWGLRVVSSSAVLVYGAGLYSFFDNYSQDCIATESCQENIVSIESCGGDLFLWGLNTEASVNMVAVDGSAAVTQAGNMNAFTQTIAEFSC